MNKLTRGMRWVACATLALGIGSPAFAQVAGDPQWLVRTTVIGVLTNASSRTLGLDVKDTTDVALDITYFATPNIGLNLLATFLNTEVTAKGFGSVGSVDLLPPILTVQWHFAPQAQVRPYVGIGFNYNHFSRESGTLSAIHTKIENKFGGVVQVGLDYMLTKSLSLNADLKYLQVKPEVRTDLGNDKLNLRATIIGVGLGYRF